MSEDSKSAHRVPRWLLLVAAMTAVGPVSIDMYLPGFPAIERDFGEQGVEGTMAAFLIGIAVGQLIYGPLSDRFGRKPPLYVGFVLYTLGAIGCAFSTSMLMLTVMRVVQALGGCSGMVIGRAIVRDRCEPHEAARAFSTLMMIVALGPVLAPAIGGVVVTGFGWRATFIFQALVGIVLLVGMHKVLQESVQPGAVTSLSIAKVFGTYWRLCRDRQFLGYSLLGGFGMGALFCYVTGAPTVLTHRYDLSPQQFGLLIGLNGFAFMAASRLNMISLNTLGPREAVARYVWIPSVLGVALLALTALWDPPLWLIVAVQLSFFVSVGRVNPNVAALALAPHGKDAGTASALMGSIQSVLGVAAGLSVAVFNDGTVMTLAAIMTGGVVCGLLSYLWVRAGGTKSG